MKNDVESDCDTEGCGEECLCWCCGTDYYKDTTNSKCDGMVPPILFRPYTCQKVTSSVKIAKIEMSHNTDSLLMVT